MRFVIAAVAFLAGPAAADPPTNPLVPGARWEALRQDVLGDAMLVEEAPFEVDAPYRAQDGANVRVGIRQTDPGARITGLIIVIDENPAPIAAEIEISPEMLPLDFELLVRVDQYSNVRVIGETPSGLHMDGRFVKASGGCSAPASSDPEEALASAGEMLLKTIGEARQSTPRRMAEVAIQHPNYSGLQRDQITHLFIPAHFIDRLEVWQGEEMLFSLSGGISIAENPVFRFAYRDNGAPELRIVARDTQGNVWDNSLPKDARI